MDGTLKDEIRNIKQGDRDDAQKMTAFWTCLRENQIKQIFFEKGDHFIFVKILFCRISSSVF